MRKNIIFFLPNFSEGGAGNSILRLCEFLKKKFNINIIIISLGENSFKKYFFKLNIKVIEIKKKKLIFAINDLKEIINPYIYKDEKLIFVSNINYSNLICSIFLKRFISKKFKLVLIERTPIEELDFGKSLIQKFKNKLIKFLIKHYYRNASYIIANSSHVAKSLQRHVRCKVQTINPITEFKKFKKKYNVKKKILWIGRNSFEKNINDLFDLIKATVNQNYEISIITNFDKNKNYNLLNKHYKKIKFIKYSNKKLDKIYLKSDIVISTSLYEGFPNVVAEGINHECLIVSSKNIGGIYDLVKNQDYGVFYEINNISQLSIKLKDIIDNFSAYKKKIKKSKQNLLKLSLNSKRDYFNLFKKI